MSAMSKLAYELDNPIIVESLPFYPKPAKVVVTEYVHSGDPAIIGVDPETECMIWKASHACPELNPSEGCVYIKSHGPNEGMLDALIKKGVIEFTGTFEPIGQGRIVYECRLII